MVTVFKMRDKIHYDIRQTGEVVLTRAPDVEHDDPVLDQFLNFLASDIANRSRFLRAWERLSQWPVSTLRV